MFKSKNTYGRIHFLTVVDADYGSWSKKNPGRLNVQDYECNGMDIWNTVYYAISVRFYSSSSKIS